MADLSGSITTGGTAQQVAPFNPRRRGLLIQVPDTEERIWVRFGGVAAAASPSIHMDAGDSLMFGAEHKELITRSISIFGATTAKKFTMLEALG